MTDTRDQRITTLTTAAQAKSAAKTTAADQAIRALIKRGESVTFQAVGREAGVSHSFLYSHPELRSRIEHLRSQAQPRRIQPPAPPDTENTLLLTLTTQINHLKKQHRQEMHALRAALEQAHGENLELRRELNRRGRAAHAQPPGTDH